MNGYGGKREGRVKVNADYLNIIDIEVGAINAEIKELGKII